MDLFKKGFTLAEVFLRHSDGQRRVASPNYSGGRRSNVRLHLTSSANAPLYRKFGFTLAEVLITLGIIGVVAAMTMPALVAKYQEKQRVSQLKKAYSTLSQAYLAMINDYGTLDTWGISTTSTGETNEDGSPVLDRQGQYDFIRVLKQYLKTVEYQHDKDTYTLANEYFAMPDTKDISIQLADGTVFEVGYLRPQSCNTSDCGEIWIKIPDGKRRLGVTYFAFLLKKNKIEPRGASNVDFRWGCNLGNKIGDYTFGKDCSAWALINENMDYLHCNDLSWNGKKTCK